MCRRLNRTIEGCAVCRHEIRSPSRNVSRGGASNKLGDPPREEALQAHTDPLWYKDAIIYELHVRAFADSNNDGIGDFPGLISKLDYLAGSRRHLHLAAAVLSLAAAR